MNTDRVVAYARERFTDHVADLLDDPSDLVYPWRDKEPSEAIAELRLLAADLGLDFDHIVATVRGSEYEVKRLKLLEQNKDDEGRPVKAKLGTLADWDAHTIRQREARATNMPVFILPGETDA